MLLYSKLGCRRESPHIQLKAAISGEAGLRQNLKSLVGISRAIAYTQKPKVLLQSAINPSLALHSVQKNGLQPEIQCVSITFGSLEVQFMNGAPNSPK